MLDVQIEDDLRKLNKPKAWALIADRNDGELRIVPTKAVREYLNRFSYSGAWDVVLRNKPFAELFMFAKLGGPMWMNEDYHFGFHERFTGKEYANTFDINEVLTLLGVDQTK